MVKLILKSVRILNELRHANGLFSASRLTVNTGYDKSWIRDNVYTAMGLEAIDPVLALRTYKTLLQIMIKHEYKIDWAIREKPLYKHQYIHARYDPNTLNEIWDEWGNKQNDAIGLLLFKIGDLREKGLEILNDEEEKRIVQKLVYYLRSVEYWHDCDNGIWEENEEVHASSVGACVAGLKAVSRYVEVPRDLIRKGEETLNRLLPRESDSKETDLALLSLIYPLNVVTPEQAEMILKDVEEKLVRERGIIRYDGDQYYNRCGEAEWTMGFPWLSVIYKKMGNIVKHKFYLHKTIAAMNSEGELPELYFSNTDMHNQNTPLGWSQALYLIAVN